MSRATTRLCLVVALTAGALVGSPTTAQAAPGDGQVSCRRVSTQPGEQGSLWGSVPVPGASTGTQADYVVTYSDGSRSEARAETVNDWGDGPLVTIGGDLPSTTARPASVEVTVGGATRTVALTDPDGTCSPAVPTPKITQTMVCGADNDQVRLATTAPVADSGWQGGTRTLRIGEPYPPMDGDGRFVWYQDGETVGASVTYTLTDAGECTAREVTETRRVPVTVPGTPATRVPVTVDRTVPVFATRTTTTDPVVGTFQVDAYRPRTAAQVNTVRANSERNVLPYRFDGPRAGLLARYHRPGRYQSLWGASTVEFVTVKRSDVVRAGSLRAAIDAKTTKVPDIGGAIARGKTYVTAWRLPAGATPRAPWTTRPDMTAATMQVEWDKVTVPAATTTTTRVQTGTKVVQETTYREVPGTPSTVTYRTETVTRTVRTAPVPDPEIRVTTQFSVT